MAFNYLTLLTNAHADLNISGEFALESILI